MTEAEAPDGSEGQRTQFARQLGKRLRRLRQDQSLSLEELSRKSGVSTGYLSLVERGERTPGSRRLAELATSLGVPVGHLLGESRTQPSDFHPVLERIAKLLEDETLASDQRERFETVLSAVADVIEVSVAHPLRATDVPEPGPAIEEDDPAAPLLRAFAGREAR